MVALLLLLLPAVGLAALAAAAAAPPDGEMDDTGSWISCPATQSIVSGSCNDPNQPCVAGSGNFNAGQVASLEACQAACVASAANFTCRAVEWHGPSTGSWAGTCVLQKIASFKPAGSDSGHNSACLPSNGMPLCTPGCIPSTFRFAQARVYQLSSHAAFSLSPFHTCFTLVSGLR